MSARKTRPAFGALVEVGMSLRDQAAAIGVSKSELQRWRRLAELPEEEFERRLKQQLPHLPEYDVGASSILRNGPVPARGRVARAQALVRAMSTDERLSFMAWLADENLAGRS